MGVLKLVAMFLVGILVGPVAADAQKPAKKSLIGYLSATASKPLYEAFRQGLRELGYAEGQNLTVEFRSAEGRARLTELASELARLKVDVIVTPGVATGPAKKATGTVPIVFLFSGDPIQAGFVDSLARPGGNMTGVTLLSFELVGKRLELLKEVAPRVSRVAVLANPAHPGEERELKETQGSARALGVTLQYYQVRGSADFDRAFDAILTEKSHALLVFPDALMNAHRARITEFAARHRLPSAFGWMEHVEAGGLISYGPDRLKALRRLAIYVDKILKGAKPADLPVEQPTKFELVINLKTAKALGVKIPAHLLMEADKVIE